MWLMQHSQRGCNLDLVFHRQNKKKGRGEGGPKRRNRKGNIQLRKTCFVRFVVEGIRVVVVRKRDCRVVGLVML
jgi:hypothetical protein